MEFVRESTGKNGESIGKTKLYVDDKAGHSFKTVIGCGGGAEFMRVPAEEVYGILPEQVIGSSIKTKYEVPTANRCSCDCRNSASLITKPGSRSASRCTSAYSIERWTNVSNVGSWLCNE